MGSSKKKQSQSKQAPKLASNTLKKVIKQQLPNNIEEKKQNSTSALVLTNKPPKPASMQKVLQCLQNPCNVEVENIDYILNGRRSVKLSELPEWYYSDEAYGFDYLSSALDCDAADIGTVDPVNDIADPLNIKIVDTFSLAKSEEDAKIAEFSSKFNQNHVDDDIVKPHTASTKWMNKESSFSNVNGVCGKVNHDIFQTPHPGEGFGCNFKEIFEPTRNSIDVTPSADEIKSIFQSSQLDNILAVETKKLEANLDSLLERLNASSQNMPVLYDTPKSQANYIKTLKTALLERSKTSFLSEKPESGMILSTVDACQVLERDIVTSCTAGVEQSQYTHNASASLVPKPFQGSLGIKQNAFPMLQVLNQSKVESSLAALQIDVTSAFKKFELMATFGSSKPVNSKLVHDTGTASAIKKRLSKMPFTIADVDNDDTSNKSRCLNNVDMETSYAETSKNYSSFKAQPLINSYIGPMRYLHVSLNTDSDLFHTQLITQQLAEISLSALRLHSPRKILFQRRYPIFQNMKMLKRVRKNLNCLQPISLNQAIGKYLTYQGKKWRCNKIMQDFVSFCFHQLPVSISSLKESHSHLKLRIVKHKLSWQEFLTPSGLMIFPESYSVPDDTILFKTSNSYATNFSVHDQLQYMEIDKVLNAVNLHQHKLLALKSLTCARVRPFQRLALKKQLPKKKVPLRTLLPSSTIASTFTMNQDSMSFQNLEGSVMVVQLSHSKRKHCHMTVKIMSFCEWGSKSEEILNIIIENHYELQNMQRGRYIRTCMDGFLIEVLRVTSSQVCFKNMPAKVIDEMHQAPSPVVSLAKVSSDSCSSVEVLQPDRLINFTEAIEDMLKLDKSLAASQTQENPKTRVLTLEQTKEETNKTKQSKSVDDIAWSNSLLEQPITKRKPKTFRKKATKSKPLVQKSPVSKHQPTPHSAVATSNTTISSNSETSSSGVSNISDFESLIKNVVEARLSHIAKKIPVFDTPSNTSGPLDSAIDSIVSDSSNACSTVNCIQRSSSVAGVPDDTQRVSYQLALGKLGCLNQTLGRLPVQTSDLSSRSQSLSNVASQAPPLQSFTDNPTIRPLLTSSRIFGSGQTTVQLVSCTTREQTTVVSSLPFSTCVSSSIPTLVSALSFKERSIPAFATTTTTPIPLLQVQSSVESLTKGSVSTTLCVSGNVGCLKQPLDSTRARTTIAVSLEHSLTSVTSSWMKRVPTITAISSTTQPLLSHCSLSSQPVLVSAQASDKRDDSNRLHSFVQTRASVTSCNKQTSPRIAVAITQVPSKLKMTTSRSNASAFSQSVSSVSLPTLASFSSTLKQPSISNVSSITSIPTLVSVNLAGASKINHDLAHKSDRTAKIVTTTQESSSCKTEMPNPLPTLIPQPYVNTELQVSYSSGSLPALQPRPPQSRFLAVPVKFIPSKAGTSPNMISLTLDGPVKVQPFSLQSNIQSTKPSFRFHFSPNKASQSSNVAKAFLKNVQPFSTTASTTYTLVPTTSTSVSHCQHLLVNNSQSTVTASNSSKQTFVLPSTQQGQGLPRLMHLGGSDYVFTTVSSNDKIFTSTSLKDKFNSTDGSLSKTATSISVSAAASKRTSNGSVCTAFKRIKLISGPTPTQVKTSVSAPITRIVKPVQSVANKNKTLKSLQRQTIVSSTDRNEALMSLQKQTTVSSTVTDSDSTTSTLQRKLKRNLSSKSLTASLQDDTPASKRPAKSKKIAPVSTFILSQEESLLLKKVCCSYTLLSKCNACQMTADDVIEMVKEICRIDAPELRLVSYRKRPKLLLDIFTEVINRTVAEAKANRVKIYRSRAFVKLCDRSAEKQNQLKGNEMKIVSNEAQITQKILNHVSGVDSTDESGLLAPSFQDVDPAGSSHMKAESSKSSQDTVEAVVLLDEEVDDVMSTCELSCGESFENSTESDICTTTSSETEMLSSELSSQTHTADMKSKIWKTKQELLHKLKQIDHFHQSKRRRGRQSKIINSQDEESAYQTEDNYNLPDLEDCEFKQIRLTAEQERRSRLRKGVKLLRESLHFLRGENTPKLIVLVQAVREIRFLELEKKNLALVNEVVMNLNRNLQIYLENLQSDNSSKNMQNLNDLKKSLQIDEDKERLKNIERMHQIESLQLLNLSEADLCEIALLPRTMNMPLKVPSSRLVSLAKLVESCN